MKKAPSATARRFDLLTCVRKVKSLALLAVKSLALLTVKSLALLAVKRSLLFASQLAPSATAQTSLAPQTSLAVRRTSLFSPQSEQVARHRGKEGVRVLLAELGGNVAVALVELRVGVDRVVRVGGDQGGGALL